MPFVSADWSIAANGDIRYIGDAHAGASPSYATVIQFHRALQDFADDASAAGDDILDISSLTPSERSTDNIITLLNGYNIDQTAAEHLYDGSIIQNSGADIWDGIVNFGNASFIIVHQDGAVVGNDFWNSFTPSGFNADTAAGISHRFMIKVRDSGSDTDGRRLLGLVREFNSTYSEFPINGTSRGNNVLALSESNDLNNQTAAATVATWTTITNSTEGYNGIDVNGNSVNEFYYSEWGLGVQSINDLFERAKWITRRGTSETIYGLSGDLFRGITHEIDIDSPSGTFQEPESVSWAGGTGQLLAIDSTTSGTKMWIQLLSGSAPSDNDTVTGGTSSATADVNVTVTERSVSVPFIGASTGSALIGAYGLGVNPTDLTASDTLFDLTNSQQVPPNNVVFSVGGLVSGEDYVLVGPESGGTLDKTQFSLGTTLSGPAETQAVMGSAIPTDTPASGTIRIVDDGGFDRRVAYSSYTGSTFTFTSSEDFSGTNATSGNNVYITYLDKLASATSESFTSVYLSNRSLFIRVRDGGGSPIKTFETTGTLGSAGGSTTAIRTSDA